MMNYEKGASRAQEPMRGLLRNGSAGLGGGGDGIDTVDRFAILHHVQAVARNGLDVGGIVLEEIDLASVLGEEIALFLDFGAEILDVIGLLVGVF